MRQNNTIDRSDCGGWRPRSGEPASFRVLLFKDYSIQLSPYIVVLYECLVREILETALCLTLLTF